MIERSCAPPFGSGMELVGILCLLFVILQQISEDILRLAMLQIYAL